MSAHEHPKKISRTRTGLRVLEGGPAAQYAGRNPPYSQEAEEYLLSCIFVDNAVLAKCRAARLTPAAFYLAAHRIVYERMLELERQGLLIEPAILAEELKKSGQLERVGGVGCLVGISQAVPTTSQADYFVAKVRELWGLRELIVFSTGIIEQCYAYEGELLDMVNAQRAKLERMFDWATAVGRDRAVEQAEAAIRRSEDALAGRVDKSRWLTWGIPGFDEWAGPFDANDEDWLIILAGLRSQGKSTLGRQIAVANLEQGKKGAIFNLETGSRGWLQRAAALRAKINLRTLGCEVRKDRIAAYRRCLQEQKAWMGERLWVFDDVFTIDELEVRVREIHRACGGLDFIVVDYIQLLSLARIPKAMNREQQVAEISRRLLLLGKKLNITCFVLAQLSRKSADEARRPKISDLRESGQIENDASRVVLLYVLPEGKAGRQDEGTTMPECEIIQGKNRNGLTGYEPVVFEKPYGCFVPATQRGDARPGTVAPKAGYRRKDQQ